MTKKGKIFAAIPGTRHSQFQYQAQIIIKFLPTAENYHFGQGKENPEHKIT